MLKCIGVSKEFGGLQALKNVDLTVNENAIAGLVGPNGSGKSTLLNLISGVYKPDSGKIMFSKLPEYRNLRMSNIVIAKLSKSGASRKFPLFGSFIRLIEQDIQKSSEEDISKLPPYDICSRGITKTSQTVQSFPDMTATENVLTGVLFARKKGKDDGDPVDRARELLEFVGLRGEKFNVLAKSLNVVELRRVQLARALATKPKLLLLDELLTGLTPRESDEAIALIKTINKQGVTILMVEHVMKVIMGLCNRVTVLHHGEKICEGTPGEVCADKGVINVYLGKKISFDED